MEMTMGQMHPNILFITTDEQRFDCLGCYGNPVIRTPNMDRIAREGVRFARGYVQNPMCMPSRMALMTGRYCSEQGVNINCVGLPEHEQTRTFMQVLRDAGYTTAAIGKMHMMPKWGPFGFTYLDLVEGKADENNQYIDYLKAKGLNGKQHEAKGEPGLFGTHTNSLALEDTIDAFVGRRATQWLADREEESPFFLWVSFSNPHFPFDPPEPYDTMYNPEKVPAPVWREDEMSTKPTQRQLQEERGYDKATEADLRRMIAHTYGNITLVDDQIGELLKVVEEKGLLDHTLIAFTSDHGDHLGDHRLLHKSGVTFYDISVRVPYLIRYPARFPEGVVCEAIVESIDLPATFLDAAGVEAPQTMQGRSLVGLAEGKLTNWREDAFSEIDLHMNPQMHAPHDPGSRDYVAMICTSEWKYIHFPNLGIGELYDLVADPKELTNLFYDPAFQHRVAEMRLRLLNRFMANQRPFVGESTDTFRQHYRADHRPPRPIPGVTYASGNSSNATEEARYGRDQ
jgi:arylsulfatase